MRREQPEIALTPELLNQLHGEHLALLAELDRVCRKHGVRYFLAGGTLIGAIRHQGFIPWDDDADVEFFREEYEKFIEVCVPDLSEDFYFQDSTTDPEYNWPYGKLRRRGTHYVRSGQAGMLKNDGIGIDLFILDAMPSSIAVQHAVFLLTAFCRKILWSSVGMRVLKNPFMRMVFFLLHFISRDTALAWYHGAACRWKGRQTDWRGFFNVHREKNSPRSYAFRREWYDEVLDVPFEGRRFFVPAGYDAILRLRYFDYMQLPPPEERRGNATSEYILFSDGTEVYAKREGL